MQDGHGEAPLPGQRVEPRQRRLLLGGERDGERLRAGRRGEGARAGQRIAIDRCGRDRHQPLLRQRRDDGRGYAVGGQRRDGRASAARRERRERGPLARRRVRGARVPPA